VADERGFVAMGGAAEPIEAGLKERWTPGLSLGDALTLAVGLLAQDPGGGASRELTPAQLEVAVLDRERPRRTFRRIGGSLLTALLSKDDPTRDAPSTDDPTPGRHDTLTGEADVRDESTNPETQRPQDGESQTGER
jgi:proteasome alpha subunit